MACDDMMKTGFGAFFANNQCRPVGIRLLYREKGYAKTPWLLKKVKFFDGRACFYFYCI